MYVRYMNRPLDNQGGLLRQRVINVNNKNTKIHRNVCKGLTAALHVL